MAEAVDLIIKNATTFYNKLREDKNSRYRSWEHCYKHFYDERTNTNPDYDSLSLHLAFYLASWGMYRGSSFLLQKDYKVHEPVVREILKSKYDSLFGIKSSEFRDESNQKLLQELNAYMTNYYGSVRLSIVENIPKKDISETLITKVLMGTLGCVPAYDRYFIAGIKNQKISTGNYNLNSLLKLVEFYEENNDKLEKVRKTLKVCDMNYPQMKLLDMGFWQVGFELDEGKGLPNVQ